MLFLSIWVLSFLVYSLQTALYKKRAPFFMPLNLLNSPPDFLCILIDWSANRRLQREQQCKDGERSSLSLAGTARAEDPGLSVAREAAEKPCPRKASDWNGNQLSCGFSYLSTHKHFTHTLDFNVIIETCKSKNPRHDIEDSVLLFTCFKPILF